MRRDRKLYMQDDYWDLITLTCISFMLVLCLVYIVF